MTEKIPWPPPSDGPSLHGEVTLAVAGDALLLAAHAVALALLLAQHEAASTASVHRVAQLSRAREAIAAAQRREEDEADA